MTPFQLGEDSLQKFVQSLYKLLATDKRKFDMVVGAGNSGQIMVWISRVVFDLLHVSFPPSIVFPIYRYKDFPKKILFDNSTIVQSYSNLHISKDTRNLLFVDDEIDQGNSVEAIIQLIETLINDNKKLHYTVVAEEGEVSPKFINNSNIEYISPKKRADGVYNAISYLIPKQFSEPIKNVLQTKIKSVNNKKIMCILLQMPIKEPNNGLPQFTFRFEELVKKEISNLKELQHEYQKYLTNKIKRNL